MSTLKQINRLDMMEPDRFILLYNKISSNWNKDTKDTVCRSGESGMNKIIIFAKRNNFKDITNIDINNLINSWIIEFGLDKTCLNNSSIINIPITKL
jgi:hypothetical protein